MKILEKAQAWADKLWKKAANDWINRKQDLNYRKYVSRPAIEKVLDDILVLKNGIFFDIGCGNGSETFHLANTLIRKGHTGKLIGIDQNEVLIENAMGMKKKTAGLKISFEKLSIKEITSRYGEIDLAFSIFLLQDLPDAEIFFKTINDILKNDSYGIFLLLNPNFANAKKARGILQVEKNFNSKHWRWIAKYPIVEENDKTFYVPYFHRTTCDYLRLARKYFKNVSFLDVLPSPDAIAKSKKLRLSPLHNHPGNVYFPEIVKIPSSLIIKIQK